MFLSLPIPEKGKSNLADCLKQFQKREKLFGNERWFCPKCKAPKDSERTLELWRVPPMLIIHLKVVFKISYFEFMTFELLAISI